VSNGWWYPVNGGAGACYESNGWIYTSNGKSAFYFRLIIRRLAEQGLEAKSRTGPIAAGRPQKKNAHSA